MLARQLAYWKQQLAGALTGPSLRGDLPGTPGPTSKGGLVPMVLPGDLVRSLRSLAAACGATLFVVVLAAWKARASSCSSAARHYDTHNPQISTARDAGSWAPCTCPSNDAEKASLHAAVPPCHSMGAPCAPSHCADLARRASCARSSALA